MILATANALLLEPLYGNKAGTRAGQELWSFIAPEHYGVLKRLRDGTPLGRGIKAASNRQCKPNTGHPRGVLPCVQKTN